MEVIMHGYPIEVTVEEYLPAEMGNRSGHIDTWTEGIPESLSWYANSGNLLLDHLIHLYPSQEELVYNAILKKLKENPNGYK